MTTQPNRHKDIKFQKWASTIFIGCLFAGLSLWAFPSLKTNLGVAYPGFVMGLTAAGLITLVFSASYLIGSMGKNVKTIKFRGVEIELTNEDKKADD